MGEMATCIHLFMTPAVRTLQPHCCVIHPPYCQHGSGVRVGAPPALRPPQRHPKVLHHTLCIVNNSSYVGRDIVRQHAGQHLRVGVLGLQHVPVPGAHWRTGAPTYRYDAFTLIVSL